MTLETEQSEQMPRAALPPIEGGQGRSVAGVNPFALSAPVEEVGLVPLAPAAPKGPVTAAGKWAFEHKASFGKENPIAWYGLRNVAANMVGIAGLMGVIVGLRKGMGHGAQWAEKKGYNFLSNELSRVYTQNALGVGASFATFRTLYKVQQRSYDDVFVRPKSAEEASHAVSELPHKLWENFKQIAKVEYPVTMIGGFVLVGIRAGIAGVMPKETTAKTKLLDVVKDKNTLRDMAGCAFFAYPAFFEVIEHLGGAWQKKLGYNDPYHNEHLKKDQQGMKETFLRQIPGVASGILPYIAFNTWAINNHGRQASYNAVQREVAAANGTKATVDSFGKGYFREMPYQFFWMYTLGRDLYYDAYDKLTGAHKKQPETHGQTLPPVSGQPTAQVDHVQAQGKTIPLTGAALSQVG